MSSSPVASPSDCDCDRPQGGMLSVESARERLLGGVRLVEDLQEVPLVEARGRVLARAVVSAMNVPPHDNSAMDGYAVRSGDVGAGARLPVVQTIYAGSVGEPLGAGSAARIFTGAPIPGGADAVVMQESCSPADGKIIIPGPVVSGAHIRRAGEDIAAGATVLAPGRRLRAQELGLAASVGYGSLAVFRRPRVALFFTGDELVEPGRALGPGQIYDSNRYTLTGLLDAVGCEVVDMGVVADTLEATRATLEAAALEADLVISTGGVSVGEKDYVRLALEALGRLELWRVRVKPGKPLAFGRVGETPFIGLPGNPVSMFATFCLFVAPFLKRMAGMEEVVVRPQGVVAGFEWPVPGGRREYLRARLEERPDGTLEAVIHPRQGSGVLTSTVWAEGFVEVPEGAVVQRGDTVNYYLLENLL